MTQLSVQMDNKTKGKVISIGLHLLLLLLALWPFFHNVEWSKKDSTVVIEFTESVVTEAPDKQSEAVTKGSQSVQTTTKQEASPAASKEKVQPSSQKAQTAITEETSEIVSKNEPAGEVGTEVQPPKEPTRSFGNLFGGGQDNSDNRGRENGDPNVNNLKGLSKGIGTVGRGLSGRQIVYAPNIEDDSQKTGRVIVEICVDQSGKVTSAKYTQRGSNTNDQYLVNLAEKEAMKWRFSSSEQALQCGVITIDFKVQ